MAKETFTVEYLGKMRKENPALFNLLQLASDLSEDDLNTIADIIISYKETFGK